ncbi:MAG: tetratricopeptide repeat protein [Actinomycetota bacterium]|nr:tetratricopeptide repeat protein [Actinomycetota bacterium]
MVYQTPILRTKLLAPKAQNILKRRRLLELLHANVDRRLIVVCAQSGYGKTTLLADFASDTKFKVIWYRLDPGDNDPAVFLSYLVEAIRKEFPRFGTQTKNRLRETVDLSKERESVATIFINELMEIIPEDTLIILDDYHHVNDNSEISEIIKFLLDQLPPKVHFVILSRVTPNLPLAILKARREVAEIETDNLKFTSPEIRQLFNDFYPLSLDDEELNNLATKTEGWIASLLLLYDSLKNLEPLKRKEFIDHFMGTRDIYEYLAQEVFEQESPRIQTFLKRTSIVPFINPDLGNILVGIKDSQNILEYLEKSHVFTTRLDGIYRYHHLFQKFLEAKSIETESKATILNLRQKAARYFKSTGEWDHAIYHYFQAEKPREAAKLISKIAGEMISTSRFSTLKSWIDRIPYQILEGEPWLLIHKGKIREIQGEWDDALALYERAFLIFRRRKDKQGAGISLGRSGELYRLKADYKRAISLLDQSLNYLEEKDQASILCSLASCHLRMDPERALSLFERALTLSHKVGDKATQASVLHNLAIPYLGRGEFADALRMSNKSLRLRQELGNKHDMALTLCNIAMVHRMEGDYELSLKVSHQALEIVEEFGYRRVRGWVLWTMGETLAEMGELKQGLKLVEESKAIFEELHDTWGLCFTLRALGRLYGMQGKFQKALEFGQRAVALTSSEGGSWEISWSLADLGILYSKSQKLNKAEEILCKAAEVAEKHDNKYILTSIYLHLAAIYHKKNDQSKTQKYLEQALNLSREYEYHHLLSMEARDTLSLFTWAFTKGISMDYLGRILFRMGSERLYRRQEVTVLFADIRGFTSLSEDLAPERVRSVLNTYLAFLTEIIFQYGGTLDKYIGDAIMAFFNAPKEQKDHALRAVEVAVEMQREIKLFQAKATDLPAVSYGIGINTGEVVVGHIGSGKRLDFTVIGDNVNIASRLCSVAGKGQILISSSTYDLVKDAVEAEKLMPIWLKGKKEPMIIYNVLNIKPEFKVEG